MYTTKKNFLNGDRKTILKRIDCLIRKRPSIKSRLLKRKIYLDKFIECTINRKDAKQRLGLFEIGIDVIRNSSDINQYNDKEYAFTGKMLDGKIIEVHIREEINQKDKQLKLISIFKK